MKFLWARLQDRGIKRPLYPPCSPGNFVLPCFPLFGSPHSTHIHTSFKKQNMTIMTSHFTNTLHVVAPSWRGKIDRVVGQDRIETHCSTRLSDPQLVARCRLVPSCFVLNILILYLYPYTIELISLNHDKYPYVQWPMTSYDILWHPTTSYDP